MKKPFVALFVLATLFCLPPAVRAGDAEAGRHAGRQTGFDRARAAYGPDSGRLMSDDYIRLQARNAYFWGWPMVNIFNRRQTFAALPEPALMGGIVPVAPLNRLAMLTDYIDPGERLVACPNQDVVYGAATLALDVEPVVVQVPDFGGRFWVYQAVDIRTDSFAQLGAMYGTKPGFYLLAAPDWKGEAPAGVAKVFRSTSGTGMLIPRVFQSDTPEDKKAVQAIIAQIDVYPLSEFDGKMKTKDWSKLPRVKGAAQDDAQQGETKWVVPEKFFDELPAILAEVGPLPGEEALYGNLRELLAVAKADQAKKAILTDEAVKADKQLVGPLIRLSSFGIKLPHHWGTIDNGAAFKTDYYTRTAVARSNILVNKDAETKYFYQDVDKDGVRLNGGGRYTVTFDKDLVPVRGFWSLTVYNEYHFFAPNPRNRYSIGTKTQGLKKNTDGSLTLYVQADSPGSDKEANWLPVPKGGDFSLYIRAYWPEKNVQLGPWTPPAVLKQ